MLTRTLFRRSLEGVALNSEAGSATREGEERSMKEQAWVFRQIAAVVLVVLLGGCGGGGGSDPVVPTSTGPSPSQSGENRMAGVAAIGKALAGANVQIVDALGVRRTTTAGADGAFSFDTNGLKFPVMLRATSGSIDLFTVQAVRYGNAALNLTPLTTLVAERMARPLELAQLFAQFPGRQDVAARFNDTGVAQAERFLRDVLKQDGVGSGPANTLMYFQPFIATSTDPSDAYLEAVSARWPDFAALRKELGTLGSELPLASAGVLGMSTTVSSTTTTAQGLQVTGSLQVRFSAADRRGVPIDSLSAASVEVRDTTLNCPASFGGPASVTVRLAAPQALTRTGGGAVQPYSAFLLLDQSGSVTSTDPSNSRISGAKQLYESASATDQLGLGYFPGSSGQFSYYMPIFGLDRSSMFGALDFLADRESGDTPLYDAAIGSLQLMTGAAATGRKALVIFSDGDANGGTRTKAEALAAARSASIPIYSIVLDINSSITRTSDFVSLGVDSGGGVFFANDVGRLLGIYRSIGSLLSGAASTYSVTIPYTATNGCPNTYGSVTSSGSLRVNLPSGPVDLPFTVPVK